MPAGRKRLRKLVKEQHEKSQKVKYEDTDNDLESVKSAKIPEAIKEAVEALDSKGKSLLNQLLASAPESQDQLLEEISKRAIEKANEAQNETVDKKPESRKKRLDKLAKKVNEEAEIQEEVNNKRKRTTRMIENYALGKEDDEDFAPDPKEVAKELDNDSLYCEDEDSAKYSDDSNRNKVKNKKRKGRNKLGKGVVMKNGRRMRIYKTNKLHDDIYEEERSDDDREVLRDPGDFELE